VEEDELDLARVHRLLDEGRPGEALSLWRGPAFTDFAYERFAQSDIARLEELRLACLEERIELDLAAGRHSALVGELEALVAEHPLRERLRAQLMLALYRSGRQAEALEAFQGGRRLLTDELGLEPGQMLKDRQRAILAQDPALDLAHEAETVEQVRTETAAGTAIRRRYPLSRRGLVLAALAGAIVAAVVAVAVYTLSGDSEPEAPFAGSWASIDHDGSNQTLEVEGLAEAGSYDLTLEDDDAQEACRGGPVTGKGFGTADGTSLSTMIRLTCASGPELEFPVEWTYRAADDTLVDIEGVVWSRARAP
jgi:hypothetical protein